MSEQKLFGTDGMRGVAGQWPLTAEVVERAGFFAGEAFAAAGRRKAVLVVRDTRASGPALQKALTQGLRRAGLAVADGGVLPTASVAVLVPKHGFAGGAVISASHNPAEFNGIKLFSHEGRKLDERREEIVEAGLRGTRVLPPPSGGAAPLEGARAGADYRKFLMGTVPGLDLKGMPVVLDCANGAASAVAPALFRSLGARVTVLNAAPDGRNINRGCGALHPEALARAVVRERAALGVAFDGDADRAIFVDDTGAVMDGEGALLVTARLMKAENRLKKDMVASTVMANLGFKRALSALGIGMVETAVGDKYVAEALERTGGVLGGEPSGHLIFRQFLGTGDGLLTALQVIRAMRTAGRALSVLSSLAVKLPQILLNVPVRERRPLEEMKAFSAELRRVEARLGDGGRVLVRYSGTEPLLRIMVEGPEAGLIKGMADGLARLAV